MSDWREYICSFVYGRMVDEIRVLLNARLLGAAMRYCYERIGEGKGEAEGRRIVDEMSPLVRSMCGRLYNIDVRMGMFRAAVSVPVDVYIPAVSRANCLRMQTQDVGNMELRRELECTLRELDQLNTLSGRLWTALTEIVRSLTSVEDLARAYPQLEPYLPERPSMEEPHILLKTAALKQAVENLQQFRLDTCGQPCDTEEPL